MKRVLVTGSGPASTNFMLSLRIAPEDLFLVSTDANAHHLFLSPADRTYLVPPATQKDYLDRLNEVIEEEKIEFVHPQPDIEVLIIGRNRNKVNAITYLPSTRAIEICQDKFTSYVEWKKKGLPVPKSLLIKGERDVERAVEEIGFPMWIRATRGAGGRGSTIAQNERTLRHWVEYWRSRGVKWDFIAQEYLPGRNLAFHSLWRGGELVTSMARERLEYIYPHLSPSGVTGTPAVQRTIHDERVNEIATEAVLAIDPNFTGIACVDLREDREGVDRESWQS